MTSNGPSEPPVQQSPAREISECAGRNASEHRASPETGNADADLVEIQGRLPGRGQKAEPESVCRGSGDGMRAKGVVGQHGKSVAMVRSQPVIREGQTGSGRMTDRPVVAKKLPKGGGAKGP